MVGMISFISEDTYYSGVSALEFDEDEDGIADVIILLKGDVGTSAIETQNIVIQNVINLGGEIEGRTHLVANTVIAKIDVDKLGQITSDPNVKRVIPNEKIVRIIDFDKQPSNLRLLDNSASLINADGLYSQGITGKDIVVAVVDTGINEELSIFDRNGEDVVIGKLELYGDYTHWHGNACASCIASQNDVYPGIAPGASILEVGVFTEDGYANTGDILQGWEWVVNWENANNKFVICSNSFGAPAYSDGGMLSGAVDRMAFDYGIPMICAAGNTGPGSRTIETPALAEGALAVGSVNDNLDIASFSSRGPSDPIDKKPDVVALGVSINMFDSDGNHIMESGTSFSTPITAGAVALVAESHQDHGVKQFYNAFRRSAKDLGPSGFDYDYGYGLIDVTVANEIIGNEVPESTYLYLLSGLSFMGLGIVSYPEWRKRFWKKTKKKLVYKKIFFILTIFGALILIYSLFQPAIAMSPDLNNIVVDISKRPTLRNFHDRGITISSSNPINVDQFQNDVSAGAFYIGYLGGHDGCYKQLINNERSPFIGFDVAIGKKGTPTEPLYIGVLKNGLEGYESPLDSNNWHVQGSLPGNFDMPDNTLNWINADFSSNPYDKTRVNIVLISLDDPTDGNYWMWGYATDDPYVDGDPDIRQDVPCRLIWSNQDGVPQWSIDVQDKDDFAFVTYSEGGVAPNPPDITITTSSSVSAVQSVGVLTLFGGVLSGIKFRWF